MKHPLAIVSFLLLTISMAQAQQTPQLLFDEANTLLENNQYYDAMNAYRSIEKGSMVSGALFLNMGIAATQLDSLGLAKYYFLKAKEYETTSGPASEAIEYIESQFSRQSATLPKLPWDKAVDWLKDGPGAVGVFFIGFVFIILACIFILLHWLNVSSPKKIRAIISTSAGVGILIVLLSFYVDYVDERYSQALIVFSEIHVKQNATDTSDLVSIAYEGYSVTIDQTKSNLEEGWLYIRLGNGQFGWIKNSGVKIL